VKFIKRCRKFADFLKVFHVFIAVAVMVRCRRGIGPQQVTALTMQMVKVTFKPNKALDENSSLSYGTSPAVWDYTVLPATRHKWTRPALTPASKLVLDLPTPEGWMAELT